MMELKFYRHKEYKDLYLVRTNEGDGDKNAPYYRTTSNLYDAIDDVLECNGVEFFNWYKRYPNSNAEAVLAGEKVYLPIKDFELVTLREVEE